MSVEPKSLATNVRWLAIGISVAGVLAVVAIIGLFCYWPSIADSLKANNTALVGLSAIATAVAAVIGACGLVVAGIAARAAVGLLEAQEKTARAALQIEGRQSSRECLWRFTDEWRDVILKKDAKGSSHWTRGMSALRDPATWKRKVKPRMFNGEADTDVIELLNFFDGVGFMMRHGHLNAELAWNSFASNGLRVHALSVDFVKAYREHSIKRFAVDEGPKQPDFSFWEDFDWWAGEIKKLDDARVEAANERQA